MSSPSRPKCLLTFGYKGSHRTKDLSQEEARKLGLFNTIVGHVGDGNFHETIFFDPNNESQKEAVMDCVHRMMDRAIAMEGTVSGEHAIGLGKKVFSCRFLSAYYRTELAVLTSRFHQNSLVDELGLDTIHLMKELKRALDPK